MTEWFTHFLKNFGLATKIKWKLQEMPVPFQFANDIPARIRNWSRPCFRLDGTFGFFPPLSPLALLPIKM